MEVLSERILVRKGDSGTVTEDGPFPSKLPSACVPDYGSK